MPRARACAVRGDASDREPSKETLCLISQVFPPSVCPRGDPSRKTLCLAWQVPPSSPYREGFCRREEDREGQSA